MSKEEESSHLIENTEDSSGAEDVKPSRRRCKGWCSRTCIIIAVGVILFLISAAVAGIVAAAVNSKSSNSRGGRKFTLDDIFNDTFVPKLFSAQWFNGSLLYRSVEGAVVVQDPDIPNADPIELVPADVMDMYSVEDYKVHSGSKYVLLISNVTKVYRHSFLADYHIYDIDDKAVSRLLSPIENTRIQYATWSPSDSPQLAFVAGYTIFKYDLNSAAVNVTAYGMERVAVYGIPDWVYEEEVLATNCALWWAPDGEHVAYAVFNDSVVEDFNFPYYGFAGNPYTDIISIAYPKAGTSNPVVSLVVSGVSDVTDKILLQVPSDVGIDAYFVAVTWVNTSHVQVTWLDREQSTVVYTLYDINKAGSIGSYFLYNSEDGWIELVQPAVVYQDGPILTLLSRLQDTGSEFVGYIQIAQINWVEDDDPVFLTSGQHEVTQIVATSDDDIVYISANPQPYQRHVYSFKSGKCLSCDQSLWGLPIEDHCDYFTASCDLANEKCLLHCQGPSIPYSIVMKYDSSNGELSPMMIMEDNSELVEAIKGFGLPTSTYFTIKATSDGDPELYGKMLKPDVFQSDQSYRTLVHVYGGPYSQMIAETSIFYNLWALYMTSEHNMIIVSVDGRGTGFRGDDFKYAVYRQLGLLETEDQLRTGEYLRSLSYVDGSSLAIYGTSYGGYMAALVGTSGSGVYSKAIVRSPVTDWRYYDSIYTERYMGQPTEEDNLSGYEASSVLPRAGNFSDVDLLLIHGTGDDNVHFQNTAQLVSSLTEAGVQFQLQVYTDKAHALAGEETRRHLYTLISSFLLPNQLTN